MPASTPRKTPGNLPPPPSAEAFARLPLGRLCRKVAGVYQRLHARDPESGLGEHPARIDGIYYPSRHDDIRRNLALFRREHFLPAQPEPRLTPLAHDLAAFGAREDGPLLYGPPICLREHPQLHAALVELEVGLLPE